MEKLKNTKITTERTRFILGKCLKKAFDENINDALACEELLFLAWDFKVPQFDEMFADHQNHDYNGF